VFLKKLKDFLIVSLAAAALMLVAMAGTATAQFPRYQSSYQAPYGPPPVSPYQGGYGGFAPGSGMAIRQSQAIRRSVARQRWQLNQAEAQIQGLQRSLQQQQIAPTGTGATFFNYSHYYSFPGRRR